MKLLSIIIPHYNSFNKLKRLIDSIPDLDDIQIIIIDDCSTEKDDSTTKLYKDNINIIYMENEKNSGAGFSRNRGLKIATGEYVLFADSDDFFDKNIFLEILLKKDFLSNDIAFFCPIGVNEYTLDYSKRGEKTRKNIEKYCKQKSNKNELTIRTKINSACFKIYNRNFLLSNNIFFDETNVSNDVMFSLKSGIAAKNIFASTQILYIITESDKSLTRINNKKNLLERLYIYLNYIKFLQNNLTEKQLRIHKFVGLKYIIRNYKIHRKINIIFTTYFFLKKNNISLFKLHSIKNKN